MAQLRVEMWPVALASAIRYQRGGFAAEAATRGDARMDAFSYLSVLLSIILGLAITQILMGYRGLLLARGRVRFYAPTMTWSVLLLVIAAQNWWASFGLSHHQDWTFLQFSAVLLQTVLLYMMAGLVLPDIPPEAPVDLREHYFRERRPFYGAFVLMLAVSISKDWILQGRLP